MIEIASHYKLTFKKEFCVKDYNCNITTLLQSRTNTFLRLQGSKKRNDIRLTKEKLLTLKLSSFMLVIKMKADFYVGDIYVDLLFFFL